MATRYVNTSTGNDTTGTGTSGLPYASLGKAVSVSVTGDTIHVGPAGTITISSTTDNAANGTVNLYSVGCARIKVYGYAVTPGDSLGTNTYPVVLSASGISNTYMVRTNQTLFYNLQFQGNSLTGVYAASLFGTTPSFTQCRFSNFASNAVSGSVSGSVYTSLFDRCIFEGASGGNDLLSNSLCFGCVFQSNTLTGGAGCLSGGMADACLFFNNGSGTACVKGSASSLGCIISGNAGYGYFPFSGSNESFHISDVIANHTGSLLTGGDIGHRFVGCAVQSSLVSSFGTCTVEGTITLTADPFTNASGGNFAPNNVTGGGKLLRAAGLPGAFPGGITTSYPDIGAVQSRSASGGVSRSRQCL